MHNNLIFLTAQKVLCLDKHKVKSCLKQNKMPNIMFFSESFSNNDLARNLRILISNEHGSVSVNHRCIVDFQFRVEPSIIIEWFQFTTV